MEKVLMTFMLNINTVTVKLWNCEKNNKNNSKMIL